MDAQSSMTYLAIGGLLHWLAIAFGLGYVIGALPLGRLIRRSAGLPETEALDTLRAPGGLAAVLADAAKGLAAVFLASHLYGTAPALMAAAGVVLGAAFPAQSLFRGGQPLATFFGAALAVAPEAAIVFAAVWAALSYTTTSLAAAAVAVIAPPISAALAPITTSARIDSAIPLTLALMALIVLLAYARDLWRLARGRRTTAQSA